MTKYFIYHSLEPPTIVPFSFDVDTVSEGKFAQLVWGVQWRLPNLDKLESEREMSYLLIQQSQEL